MIIVSRALYFPVAMMMIFPSFSLLSLAVQFGEYHPITMQCYLPLARVCWMTGDPITAEGLLRGVIAKLRSIKPRIASVQLAICLSVIYYQVSTERNQTEHRKVEACKDRRRVASGVVSSFCFPFFCVSVFFDVSLLFSFYLCFFLSCVRLILWLPMLRSCFFFALFSPSMERLKSCAFCLELSVFLLSCLCALSLSLFLFSFFLRLAFEPSNPAHSVELRLPFFFLVFQELLFIILPFFSFPFSSFLAICRVLGCFCDVFFVFLFLPVSTFLLFCVLFSLF